ncbi:MAG: DUF1917 domain-containing protein [Chloroflexi bacterium]|nr:DUF1917 domain-containing protein [Chloroflexota bacterium]MCY3581937.1 DUF1917 domain-containing protein [Chloroflexota bacterium]MCY3716424.1 DUF1917 domain-containing protein [Chloroflexota bacterium]MDE2650926.1 DUF1917 domain-containing protein [Chloroflexota bacterium]MXX51230.1 DUF1917 domain-containing protein [Chloroflexota bacterium]
MPEPTPSADINLALIQMVQDARMLHDATALPSDYAAVYWIEAKPAAGDTPAPTALAGEWRVSLRAHEVDNAWQMVKAATIAGELGYKSKVSTRPATGQAHPDQRLLCVRVGDAQDTQAVARIKAALLAMGLRDLVFVSDSSRLNPPDKSGGGES